jgi:hypothetical protein
VPIVVRSRYHRHIDLLALDGATSVVDEEQGVGDLLGQKTLAIVASTDEGSGSTEPQLPVSSPPDVRDG